MRCYIKTSATLILLCVLALGFSSSTFAQETRIKKDVSGFHSLRVSDAFVVEISVSGTESLEIEIEDSHADDVIAEVRGGTLIIALDERAKKRRRVMKSSPKAYLNVKSLDEIKISGAVSLRTLDILETERMDLNASGSSVVKIELDVSDFYLDVSGACVIEAEGTAENQEIGISGSSKYKAYNLESKNVKVKVSGASEALVNASEDLDARASGASQIKYRGNPSTTKSTSGASSVRKS